MWVGLRWPGLPPVHLYCVTARKSNTCYLHLDASRNCSVDLTEIGYSHLVPTDRSSYFSTPQAGVEGVRAGDHAHPAMAGLAGGAHALKRLVKLL